MPPPAPAAFIALAIAEIRAYAAAASGAGRQYPAKVAVPSRSAYKLTFARYEALVLLTFSRRGALPLSIIGERLMVHPTSVTNIISRLERQAMVIRRPNPADGRGRLAEITEQGRAVVERATRDLMAAEFGLAEYGAGQLKEIFDLLRKLRLTAGDFIPQDSADEEPPANLLGTQEPGP